MMLTMIIQRNTSVSLLNAVMYTAQNESEACAFLESVFFPNRERERKKKRESLSSGASSSAS